MKIAVLGTRGFPGVQGGVEAHCENLYPRLAAEEGHEVVVFGRAPYLEQKAPYEYQEVRVVPLACPKNKFLEAFVHTFRGVLAAKKIKPDILHIHAVGPALLIPLARLLGLRVVMTHHGQDYERKKWGRLAKAVLKFGEFCGVRAACAVIAISPPIAEHISKRFGRQAAVIPNGVALPQILDSDEALQKYGLKRQGYILAVGRFVPEKGFHDLMEAFCRIQAIRGQGEGWKLVIAGGADHEDAYSRSLKAMAAQNKDIILTGFLTGVPLQELYSHAGLFVLPSSYEGLPIVLLEAMSYGLSCLVSDISAHRGVGLSPERFFKTGDTEALASKIIVFLNSSVDVREKQEQRDLIARHYNWDAIASETEAVFRQVVGHQQKRSH